MKRFSLLFACVFCGLLSFALMPKTFAACTDADGDRYYTCESADDTLAPFAKGKEEARCDQITITQDTTDAELIIAPEVTAVAGKDVNPGEVEAPNSQVDFNCDGKITGYLPEGKDGGSDIFGVLEKILVLIGKIAVFVSVGALVYGGILFATASGDEMKMGKAKKTIFGAVIGLAIGLVAWNIVGFVTATLG